MWASFSGDPPSWNLTPAEAIFGSQIMAICGEGHDKITVE